MNSKISHIETKKELLEVFKTDKPVVIDFFAEWCGPCKMLTPVIQEIADEFAGKVVVVKVDIDNAEDLAEEYHVMAVPTIVYAKNGEAIAKAVGLQSKTQIIRQIEKM